jgi:murein DD-endopeptidase MepM/ murein hydrolase activator NlpD
MPDSADASLHRVEGKMKRGRGFADSLILAGLAPGEAHAVTVQLEPLLDFRRLKAGDRFTLFFDGESSLARLTYRTGPLEEVRLERTPGGWEAGEFVLPSEARVETITGEITSSLFESLDRLGEKDRLTMDFVDIFAWDIDFSHELQRGDTFRIVVEKIYREGAFLTYGRILAAEYRDSDELHQAYYYPFPADGGDYYTPEGQSLRKTFLRAPVSYSRISSGYSHRRKHPITRKVGPHLGVDYAAPKGTPVWAPADGVVVSATYDRRNGRKIVLRHPNGYTTYYLHLSRYAKGIKKGRKVRQKDVIGYVGSSGRSTGPHLDYRMKRGGRWRNPVKEKFPPGRPLPKEYSEDFSRYREWLSGELTSPVAAIAALDHLSPR